MRGWAVTCIVLLLAGCVGEPPPVATTASTPATPAAGTPPAPIEAPALHPVGRAWTYEGTQVYNPDMPVTVVVARASAAGYLFAAATEDDLYYEATWYNPLLGERRPDLSRDDNALLAFPLVDGKSWEYAGLTLTARAARIETPLGPDGRGFVIQGADERIERRWEYSPLVGQIVAARTAPIDGGAAWTDYRMTKVEDGIPWVWFERGELAAARNPHEPAALEVPSGFDTLVVSGGGRDGARLEVRGPAGESWSAEFSGAEEWRHAALPATPGRWVAAIAGWPSLQDAPELPAERPIGWGYMHLVPVRWIHGSP